ncbi:uncharacterized protein LOC143152234 [Ptiloglossa arizonensis]|uniref:uncharacterized protein LOC143152234 n=1 Tax=Ptiloglossa arizonensis TaxID=3350558 RepID=UPI003F9F47F3
MMHVQIVKFKFVLISIIISIRCPENSSRALQFDTMQSHLLFHSCKAVTWWIYHQRDREHNETTINIVNGGLEFYEKVVTSNEARVNLGGFVDEQNSPHRGIENPCTVHERPLHSHKGMEIH